jgi:AraC-like DNA-binding protein
MQRGHSNRAVRDALEQTRQSTKRSALRPVRGVATPLPPGEFTHVRRAPSAALQPFVEHLWCVQWRLPAGATQHVATVPHPCVHWTFEADACTLTGPHTRLWQRDLTPRGEVLGVKFRPEGFRAYWGSPVSGLRDVIQSSNELPALAFARDLAEHLFDELAGASLDTRFDAIEYTLEHALPVLAQEQLQLAALIDTARDDRELLRADAWAERAGLSLRQLQRLLTDWVGVGPKWILARYRLHEALHRLQQQPLPRLADLAADIGFADAAHFSRCFRGVLGLSPQQYARLWRS